jgi:tetratricopeptide (TPR) repeat protein
VHKLYRSLTGIAAVAIFSVVTLTGTAAEALAQAQGGQAAPQKKVKDQGEYDLFNAVTKEADGKKKIELLSQWKQKYPDSDYKEDRLLFMLQTYTGLGQAQEMLNTAKELLVQFPKNVQGLYWVAFLTPAMSKDDAESLDTAEKASNGLIGAEKPAGTKDEDWDKAKVPLRAIGHKTRGWVAWRRKSLDVAEKEFAQSLEVNPEQAEVTSWIGSVIFQQKKPERTSEVLYHFARAAVLPAAQGWTEAQRKAAEGYLERAYNSYHGQDPDGLAKLKEDAKKSALVPAGFAIESAQAIAIRKENEFREKNPQLALWMGIKKELTAPNGDQYFESNIKNAAVPKLKGTLISAKPPVRSKELVIGIENAQVPEITLKFETALAGKPKIGSVVEFEGVPTAFAKDPFNLTFETEKEKVTGLEMEAAPKPVVKKSAPVRKKK